EPARLARLLADLGGGRFAARRQATCELEELGEAAAPALRRALGENLPLETRRRIEEILEKLSPQRLVGLRALEVLEHAGTAEARDVLERLAGGVPEAPLTREARAALRRLDTRP